MIKHLFRLIWNKKKQNFLLITEMFVSFLVMFGIFTLIVFYYKNYKQPMNFDYKDVWVINYTPPQNLGGTDSAIAFKETLTKMLKSMPEIEDVSFASMNVPFGMSTNNTMIGY